MRRASNNVGSKAFVEVDQSNLSGKASARGGANALSTTKHPSRRGIGDQSDISGKTSAKESNGDQASVGKRTVAAMHSPRKVNDGGKLITTAGIDSICVTDLRYCKKKKRFEIDPR